MKVVWNAAPRTAQEISNCVAEPMGWRTSTVKSLISRLLNKRALRHEMKGRFYYYYPAVAEEDCVREERKSFVQRIYGGAVSPMLMHFIQDALLSKDELQALKHLLEEKE